MACFPAAEVVMLDSKKLALSQWFLAYLGVAHWAHWRPQHWPRQLVSLIRDECKVMPHLVSLSALFLL